MKFERATSTEMLKAMRAIEVDDNLRFTLIDVADPELSPGKMLVEVQAVSLNRGEVLRAHQAGAGFRPGWDFAGTVLEKTTDAGPPVGMRVSGYLSSGAWAERLAVDPRQVAQVPDGVGIEDAAALPVAGLTALGAIDAAGGLLGRRVLVTGATGGVGSFAVQLAYLSGADVTAVVRRPASQCEGIFPVGTRIVSTEKGLDAAKTFGPFDLIVETLGGEALGAAMGMLSYDGKCVALGVTDQAQTTFDAEQFFMTGTASLEGFVLFRDRKATPAEGMARLLWLVRKGALKVDIGLQDRWENIEHAARKLLSREFAGKAVLAVGDGN